MKIKKLDHISIGTDILEDTRAFYCDLLGLEAGFRPQLKSTGYWLYAGDDAIIHLVENGSNAAEDDAIADGKETPKSWEKASSEDMVETGMDDHVALTVEDSAGLVQHMKENGMAYWYRLLADRGLYQVFIRDPNGLILELNDYNPDTNRIEPMTVLGR